MSIRYRQTRRPPIGVSTYIRRAQKEKRPRYQAGAFSLGSRGAKIDICYYP